MLNEPSAGILPVSSGQIYDVPDRCLMSLTCDSAGIAIPESKVEPLRAVRWPGHGSLGFENVSLSLQYVWRQC